VIDSTEGILDASCGIEISCVVLFFHRVKRVFVVGWGVVVRVHLFLRVYRVSMVVVGQSGARPPVSSRISGTTAVVVAVV
jgi:hypothetical protein